MKRLLMILALLGVASPLAAQTIPETVVSWDVEIWAAGVTPGVGTPITVMNFTRSTATCNLVVENPVLPVNNPNEIRVEDPAIAGRDCQLGPTTSSGLLMALPLGNNMFATARARGATLVSARSAASNPFNRVIVPAPPVVPLRPRVQG